MAGYVDLEASWGRQRWPFRLRRADVKRLRIVVMADGDVYVTAPACATDEAVIARVARRGNWIQRQRDRFAYWHPKTPDRQYLNGETHLFLGRQLRLRTQQHFPRGVVITGSRLVVSVEDPTDRSAIRELVQAWYGAQAKSVLRERLETQCRVWQRHRVERPRLIVRALKNRWGSLTAAGNLVLNVDLVRASPMLIDYVIAHELAHVIHPDHGDAWRALLTRVMPDWEHRKAKLESQLL